MTDNIENTPTRGKGRPKGTPKKNKGFRGTPKNIIRNCPITLDNDDNEPIGLVNVRNDCFFNSVIQALFSLQSFRYHVNNFNPQIPDEVEPVRSVKKLFRDIEARKNNPLHTHAYLKSIKLPDYEENIQFDAQECMTYIVNLFYPQINYPSNPENSDVPENCEFLLEGEESVLCYNCNKYSNKKFTESLCQIEFPELSIQNSTEPLSPIELPELDIQNSIQMKIDEMTDYSNNPLGEKMDELYKCQHCISTHPNGTIAYQARTLIKVNRYIMIQLKTLTYDEK